MLKFVLSFIFFAPTVSWGQLDTLVISTMSSPDYISVQKSLHSNTTHKLIINLDDFPPYNTQATIPNKNSMKTFKDILNLLDKRLPEVKAVYILNPTVQGMQGKAKKIMYNTKACPIYKLNFKKMTALKVVYLIGDDADDIVEMPVDFYSTPVKTIYFYNLNFPDRLKKNIQNKNKAINTIFGDSGTDWKKLAIILEI